MPLKIFISSVFREFSNERRALQEEINKLQDLFVGMELFGSDPEKPADYSVAKAQEADLYVGIFGDDYGSIDEVTGLSFTHLEYDAAVKTIPCLIYFKQSLLGAEKSAPALAKLKERLRQRHIVYTFKDVSDLKLQFLVDFIKMLRGDLFDKIIPIKRGAIPADALLSLSKGFIREQVKSVGQDKYISELYVAREAEKDVARFTDFESTFRDAATAILDELHSIGQLYSLGEEATLAVKRVKAALLHNVSGDSARSVVEDLKQAFFFNEVEAAIEEVNSLIMEVSDDRFNLGVRAFQARFAGKPFVSSVRLPSLADAASHERFRSSRKKRLETDLSYRKLLELFPAYEKNNETFLANDLLKDLSRQVEKGLKRCLVLVDKAGTGKTNVACRVAEQLSQQHPVVLLSGQMELSSEYDIEFHIQQRLESAFSGIFTDWMNRVSAGLQDAGKWLFIIIDGINENSRRPLLIQLLKGLLPRLQERRIKLILTCRDLFWDVFRDTLTPYLFEDVVLLHEFSEDEWEHAVAAYFERFDIECTPDKEAREALRNPLLLRFFCEANRGQRLGRVSNLRLLSVFDLYLNRIGQDISQRHSVLRPESVRSLLIGVAYKMWELRSPSVNPVAIGVGPDALNDSSSIYNLVLSENIILEQATHSYASSKLVRFLYDEFMEYMIARSWVNQIFDSPDQRETTNRLLHQSVDSLGTFPPALGAVLFLDKMLQRDGGILNEFIKLASLGKDFLLPSHQTSLIYAFESISFSNVDDGLIAAVQKLEPHVREDLKNRMARVILTILEKRPDDPYARTYAHQVLEIGQGGLSQVADETIRRSQSKLQFPKQSHIASNPPGTAAPELKAKKSPGQQAHHDAPRLPPARYHYSEETKINAIGILVQMKASSSDYDVIDEGIRKLGRTDLHSALQALEYIDLGGDELVYKTVASHLKSNQPEYQIYCAWLLRNRYGREAATLLSELLTSPESRVHQYTAGLFQNRFIEGELLEEILRRLGDKDLKLWHLAHLVKLLRKKSAFRPTGLGETYGARIVEALSALQHHRTASIRLEVYRALAEYPSFFSSQILRVQMQQDSDSYVRSLAEKLHFHTEREHNSN